MNYFLIDLCWNKTCHHNARCMVKENRAKCICPVCNKNDVSKPVCGFDGITYASHCLLKAAACRLQREIAVAKEEACGTSFLN